MSATKDCFRFVVIGGGACDRETGGWTHFGDANVFDARTREWQEVEAAPDPTFGHFPPRRGHCAALWREGEVVVFGGTAGGTESEGTRNDAWVLDLRTSAWRGLQPRGAKPGPRRGAMGCMAQAISTNYT